MSNISEIEKERIEEIRQGLKRHRGSMKELVERVGLDRVHVYKVLKGLHVNRDVYEKAAAILVEREQYAADVRDKMGIALDAVKFHRPVTALVAI